MIDRCPLRSARQSILPPVRFNVPISKSLHPERNAGWLQWHTRERNASFRGYPTIERMLNTEQAISTLSLLEPFRRALFGIPFIYQRVSSTTPYTALISTKSKITSLVVVHLDGRLDWMIAQRNALFAWTGHNLSVSPRINTKMVQPEPINSLMAMY